MILCGIGHHTCCQDCHIDFGSGHLAGQRIFGFENKIPGAGYFRYPSDFPAVEEELLILLNFRVEVLHPSGRTNVYVKHVYLSFGISFTNVSCLFH